MALLYRYINSVSVYRCPADSSTQNFPLHTGAPRIRSLSCSQVFGPGNWLDTATYLNYTNKLNSVVKPSETWVFIDEEAHSINDGGFAGQHDGTHRQFGPGAGLSGGLS